MMFYFSILLVVTTANLLSIQALVPPKTPVLSGFEPAAIGSYRELVCDADQPGAGTITYKWFKYSDNAVTGEDWERKGPIGPSQKYIFNPVTKTRVFHQDGQSEVSGKYKCRASNSAGTRDSEWGDLYVYKPCSLYTVPVSPPKPAVGSTFTVNCYIPNPSGFTVTWTKRADTATGANEVARANSLGCRTPSNSRYSWSSCSKTSSTSRTFNIQVTNAQRSDSGYWICTDAGLTCGSNPMEIVVQAPPGTPQITGFPSGPVVVGTQLNLKCVASPRGDTYDWYKDNTKLSTSLTYDFLVKKESAGVYICVARNNVGSAASSEKTLIVYIPPGKPQITGFPSGPVLVGTEQNLKCVASPPGDTYDWYKDNTKLTTSSSYDFQVKKESAGVYKCVARNAGGSATSSDKTLTVYFPNTKVSFSNNPTAAVQVGQVKTFRCQTDESNPITSIKWFKYIGSSWQDITTGISSSERIGAYGGKIRISDLSITATKAMNGVSVKCQSVYAGHGFTGQAVKTMNVKWLATELKMVNKPSTPITAGGSVSIKCETDSSNSGSPETISWYRNNQQITSGVTTDTRQASDGGTIYISQLTFKARKEDNQAKYECKIDQTSFKKEVTITVYFPPDGIHLSETSITVREGESKTITCRTTSSSNPAVSVSVKKKLGSTEVDVTGSPSVTNGANSGKDVTVDIKLDTNRTDNGAQYICTFTYDSTTTFRKTATVNIQFNPTKITMMKKPLKPVIEKNQLQIVCETDSANPAADIKFERMRVGENFVKLTSGISSTTTGAQYNGIIRTSTLTVTSASRDDNQAMFQCQVKEGSTPVAQTVVTVYYPPTNVSVSSNPKRVKEGDDVTLTCEASGGNPTTYSYSWYYNRKEIQNEIATNYTVKIIEYTQTGPYHCRVENYSPGGVVSDKIQLNILYKAKWNPDFPKVIRVASKPTESVTFVLHVIANPPPTAVAWMDKDNKPATDRGFSAAKVNDTTYELKKTIATSDYGEYTAKVTNDIGITAFIFRLQETGPPYTPCCLAIVSVTTGSVNLTFKRNFSGGSKQTFTVEKRTDDGKWKVAKKGIPDPGLSKNVTVRISGLKTDTNYHFRVKAVNDEGSSAYGEILQEKTKGETVPYAAIGGGVGGTLGFLIILAIVLVVVFVIRKRRVEKGEKILSKPEKTGEVNPAFTDVHVDDGFNPYENERIEMASSPPNGTGAAAGGAAVNKTKSHPVDSGYIDVELTQEKGGVKEGVLIAPEAQPYAQVDLGKKKKKGKGSAPSAGPGGAVYAEVQKKKDPAPVGTEYAQVDLSKKRGKKDAGPAPAGDVYAEVNKPKKGQKPGKKGSDDTAVYANVNQGGDDNVYEDVRNGGPSGSGYGQGGPRIGVDGTIYTMVNLKPPKNPDVIRGKETIEDPYASVDFSREAPPLPAPEDPDDKDDPGFMELI